MLEKVALESEGKPTLSGVHLRDSTRLKLLVATAKPIQIAESIFVKKFICEDGNVDPEWEPQTPGNDELKDGERVRKRAKGTYSDAAEFSSFSESISNDPSLGY